MTHSILSLTLSFSSLYTLISFPGIPNSCFVSPPHKSILISAVPVCQLSSRPSSHIQTQAKVFLSQEEAVNSSFPLPLRSHFAGGERNGLRSVKWLCLLLPCLLQLWILVFRPGSVCLGFELGGSPDPAGGRLRKTEIPGARVPPQADLSGSLHWDPA